MCLIFQQWVKKLSKMLAEAASSFYIKKMVQVWGVVYKSPQID